MAVSRAFHELPGPAALVSRAFHEPPGPAWPVSRPFHEPPAARSASPTTGSRRPQLDQPHSAATH